MQPLKNNVLVIVGSIVLLLAAWGIYKVSTRVAGTGDTATTTATSTNLQNSTTSGSGSVPSKGSTPVAGTPGKPKTLDTYTNGPYKFSISYPKGLVTMPFTAFHQLSSYDWRVNATSLKRGTPVVSVPIMHIDQSPNLTVKAYPLYYAVEVRIGVSNDTKQCYATDDGYTNQQVTNVTIQGVPFKKFAFGTAATMQYVEGNSYRTIHDNKCYVIEQVRNGTTYRDASTTPGYTQAQLDNFYSKAKDIIATFTFTD